MTHAVGPGTSQRVGFELRLSAESNHRRHRLWDGLTLGALRSDLRKKGSGHAISGDAWRMWHSKDLEESHHASITVHPTHTPCASNLVRRRNLLATA